MAKLYFMEDYTKEELRQIEIDYFESLDVHDPNDELDTFEEEEQDEDILDYHEHERFSKLLNESANLEEGQFTNFILTHWKSIPQHNP